jgi:hypothetical protein
MDFAPRTLLPDSSSGGENPTIAQRVHGTSLEFLDRFYGVEWESGWFDADLVQDCPGSLLLHHKAHREGLGHGFDSETVQIESDANS